MLYEVITNLSDDFEPTKYEDGGSRENSDLQRNSLFTNLSYRATDATTLGFTMSHVTGDNGKPPSTKDNKTDPFAKNPKWERIDDLVITSYSIHYTKLYDQKELGERSGIRANHISAIERGMPYGLKTAKRLSDALDVPVGLLT